MHMLCSTAKLQAQSHCGSWPQVDRRNPLPHGPPQPETQVGELAELLRQVRAIAQCCGRPCFRCCDGFWQPGGAAQTGEGGLTLSVRLFIDVCCCPSVVRLLFGAAK